jgi:hypothetical protein
MLDKTNKNEVITAAHMIPGWCYLHELALIYELVKDSKFHVEIGTFCGKATFVAGLAMENGSRIVGVDAMNFGWIQDADPHFRLPYIAGDHEDESVSWTEDVFDLTCKAIKLHNPDTDISLIREPSVRAAIELRDEEIDTIYIDGNHSFDGVCFDIESWYPALKPGGIMFGHDYCPSHIDVMEAVNFNFGGDEAAKYPGGFRVQGDTRIWIHIKPVPPPQKESKSTNEPES